MPAKNIFTSPKCNNCSTMQGFIAFLRENDKTRTRACKILRWCFRNPRVTHVVNICDRSPLSSPRPQKFIFFFLFFWGRKNSQPRSNKRFRWNRSQHNWTWRLRQNSGITRQLATIAKELQGMLADFYSALWASPSFESRLSKTPVESPGAMGQLTSAGNTRKIGDYFSFFE